ncbi:VIT1/CCC1 transporter family protein [Patescibacteria group bacterium]|nr:VIT1/CCC1 transporter family protein [Patescibacteria group bacterium]
MGRFIRRSPPHTIPFGAERFLAAFEGFEGGFAIGAGVIAGMSFASVSREILIMTAVVSIIVNGFNSASVKYSSEHYMDELDGREERNPFRDYFLPSLIQFISYFAISFISIIPFLLLSNLPHAIAYSCAITVVILLISGYYRAAILGMPRWRDAFEIALLGSGIILVGLISGWIIHVALKA